MCLGCRPAAPAPSPAELQQDGCARRRREPRVEQLPGNRLLSRPTLRPLSPSQGPFSPPPPPFSLEPDPAVQVRNCSQCHQQPPSLGVSGTHGPRRGRERERRFWERGGGEWEARVGCEKFCWDTSLPDFITARPSSPHTPKPPQAALKKPEPSPFSYWKPAPRGWGPRIYPGPGLSELGTGAAP